MTKKPLTQEQQQRCEVVRVAMRLPSATADELKQIAEVDKKAKEQYNGATSQRPLHQSPSSELIIKQLVHACKMQGRTKAYQQTIDEAVSVQSSLKNLEILFESPSEQSVYSRQQQIKPENKFLFESPEQNKRRLENITATTKSRIETRKRIVSLKDKINEQRVAVGLEPIV